jgi:hypothetical protein
MIIIGIAVFIRETNTKSIIGLSVCPIKTTTADAEKQMSRLTLKLK